MTLLRLLFFSLPALGYCPPTGPVLPLPVIPSNFKSGLLSAALEAAAKGSDSFNSTATSFSFSVTSADSTFLEYHHTAPSRNATGVEHVDKDTVYRVASNTKMYMALASLLEFSNLDDPIGVHIQELASEVAYKEVTLRLLASHLAGVPRDGEPTSFPPSAGRILTFYFIL